MAERYAVATGNWSSTSTWNGGTLPGAGDDVYSNGYVVTIDQDVTVLTLRNTAGATAVAGGLFVVSGVRVINADVYRGSGGSYTLQTSSNAWSFTLNGDSYNPSGEAFAAVLLGPSCVQNGDSYGGSGSNRSGTYIGGGIQYGNAYGAAGNGSSATRLAQGHFVGDAYGGTSLNAYGVQAISAGVIIGNAFGGSASGAVGVRLEAGIFYGNATGGSASGGHGIDMLVAYGVVIAIINTATGNTSGAFGVRSTSTNTHVVLIKTESGSFAKSLGSGATSDDALADFVNYNSGGGGSSRPFLPFSQGVIG